MGTLCDEWKNIRVAKGYQGLFFDMTLQFNTMSSMLRVEVSKGDCQHSLLVGAFVHKGKIPEKGIAQALIDGDLGLDLDTETLVQEKAYTLIQLMNNERSHDLGY